MPQDDLSAFTTEAKFASEAALLAKLVAAGAPDAAVRKAISARAAGGSGA